MNPKQLSNRPPFEPRRAKLPAILEIDDEDGIGGTELQQPARWRHWSSDDEETESFHLEDWPSGIDE